MKALTRQDVLSLLTNEAGETLQVLPWWTEAFTAMDAPDIFELLLVLTRQAGKSTLLAVEGVYALLGIPGSYVVCVAASESQQQAIYHRKIRRPLERLLSSLGLRDAVHFTKTSVEVPDLGTLLEVVVSSEATSPGRTISHLFIDEARHVQDGVFTALAPSVIGAGGKVVCCSSAGPPRGFFFTLVQNPTPETWLFVSSENDNPSARRPLLDFMRRRLALVNPSAARRELHAEFADDGEALIPWAVIDACVDDLLSGAP